MLPSRPSLYFMFLLAWLFMQKLPAQIKFQDVLPGSPGAPVFGNAHFEGLHLLKQLDENNDGLMDFYALDCDAPNLFYSNGDGSFTRHRTGIKWIGSSQPRLPISAISDVTYAFINPDGDSDLDFIMIRNYSIIRPDSVEIVYYQNHGSSLFKRDTLGLHQYPLTQVFPFDYDQDGDEDLLGLEIMQPVSTINTAYQKFVTFRNDSNHSFTRIGNIGLDSIYFWSYGQFRDPIVDYNNDGMPDIGLKSGRYNSNFARGNGTGIFLRQPPLWPYSFQWFGDLDQDGNSEGVVLVDTNKVEIYQYHAPQDTFLMTKTSKISSAVRAQYLVDVIDWNLDGYLDLLTQNQSFSELAVLLNDGQNNFTFRDYKLIKKFGDRSNPGLYPGHYRGKSKKDLYTLRGNMYLNHTDSSATQEVLNGILQRGLNKGLGSINLPYGNIGLFAHLTKHSFVKDFNGDGFPDLESRSVFGDTIEIGAHLNQRDGKLHLRPTIFHKMHRDEGLVAFDFSGDQVTDILRLHLHGNHRYYTFHQNDGHGKFTRISKDSLVLPYRISSTNSLPVDIDSDGDLDLVTVDNVNNTHKKSGILLNDGQGDFSPDLTRTFRILDDGAFQLADLNQNGYPDLVISGDTFGFETSFTQIYFNDGSQFISSGQKFTGLSFTRINIADLDHNGALDLVLSGRLNNSKIKNLVYLNDSAGHFTEVPADTFGFTLTSKAVVYDWDGDGINEIVQPEAQTTVVYQMDSGLHYSPVNTTGTQISRTIAQQGFAVDMDRDGKKDLLLIGDDKIHCVPITRHFRNLSKHNVSITENSWATDQRPWAVYPNPVQSHLYIKNHFLQPTRVSIEIFDLSGKLIQNISMKSEPSIDLSLRLDHLKSGVYIIGLKSRQTATMHFKVIKL